MKLEVGKTYVARNGTLHTVSTVFSGDATGQAIYSNGGRLGSLLNWSANGRRWVNAESDLDLVTEVIADAQPSAEPELTPWFPPEIKPVHAGWYDTQLALGSSSHTRMWWCGVYWSHQMGSHPAAEQHRYWRGLASPPQQPVHPKLWLAITRHSEVPGDHMTLHHQVNEPTDDEIIGRLLNHVGKNGKPLYPTAEDKREERECLTVSHCYDVAHWLSVYTENKRALAAFIAAGGME